MSVIGLSTVRFMDDVVLVETVSEELRVVDPDQVAVYNRLTDRLWPVAVEGDVARRLLSVTASQPT